MTDQATFSIPLTGFQRAVLKRLRAGHIADLKGPPVIKQHPYEHPHPGTANQYLIVEWSEHFRLYVYGDEVGFDGFTLERQDFATDEAQIEAMVEEIEHLRANVR